MADSGVTKDHLAAGGGEEPRHGVHNPDAMFRAEVDAEAVLASRVVCEPLHLWMLCTPNEGAAAVVLRAPAERGGAARCGCACGRPALPPAGLGPQRVDADVGPRRRHGAPPRQLAAAAAYEQAGIGPGDLDVVECQDTDAARELLAYEELGLCPPGGRGRPARDGRHRRSGGGFPVNPSGGLLSKGEPLGASALGQVVELVRQLRGDGRPSQVDGRRGGAGAHRRARRQRRGDRPRHLVGSCGQVPAAGPAPGSALR